MAPLQDHRYPTRRSLMQLKRLALAALQLTADWEGSFAFAPQYLREALRPYHPDDQMFALLDTTKKYTFTENLCAKKLLRLGYIRKSAATNLENMRLSQ